LFLMCHNSAGISLGELSTGVSDAGHGAVRKPKSKIVRAQLQKTGRADDALMQVSVCLLSIWKEDQGYEQIRSVVAGSHDEAS